MPGWWPTLSDLFTETGAEQGVTRSQIEEFVARMPEISRGLVTVHRRLRDATEELEGDRPRATAETSQPPERPMPFEEVRDFFYDRKNYIGDLDLAAEQMFAESGMRPGRVHWAGTESSAIMCGWVDGAIRSGDRAAAEVMSHEAESVA